MSDNSVDKIKKARDKLEEEKRREEEEAREQRLKQIRARMKGEERLIRERQEAEEKLEEMRRQEEKAREQKLKQIKARERDREGEIQNLQKKDEIEYKKERGGVLKEGKKTWNEQVELNEDREKIRRESRRSQWKNKKKALKKLAIGTGATVAAGGAAIASSQRQQQQPPYPYKRKSPLVKYLGILIILGALGLVIYFHTDEVSRIWGGITSTIGGILPSNFDLFLKCITFQVDDPSVCWGGEPPEPPHALNQVIDLVIEDGRGPKPPLTGEPYSVLVEVKNLLEDETLDDIVIYGRLECKLEGEEDGWGESSDRTEIDLMPLEDTYQLPPEGVRTLLEGSALNCDLAECMRLIVNVTYQHNNTLETQFRFGETREKAKFEKKDAVGQGPISLEAGFSPYGNYYYPNEGYGSSNYITNRLDLTLTAVNKGYGDGILLDYNLEKKYDDFDFLSEVEPCEFTELGTKLERDDYETCYPTYSFSKSNIENYLENYQSVFFKFTVDYEYTRSFKKNINELRRGPTCPEETEDTGEDDGDVTPPPIGTTLPPIDGGWDTCNADISISPVSQFGWDYSQELEGLWCGITSAAMLFTHETGRTITPPEVYEYCDVNCPAWDYWPSCGAEHFIGKSLTSFDFDSPPNQEEYIEYLKFFVCEQGKPVIAKLSANVTDARGYIEVIDHFVLVNGVTSSHVVYNDPATGQREYISHSDFFELAAEEGSYQIRYT